MEAPSDAFEPSPVRSNGALGDILRFLTTPEGLLVIACLGGVGLLFWPLFSWLPKIWDSADGYYSHGPLVPLISIYVIAKSWPQLRSIQVKPGWFALVPLAVLLVLIRASYVSGTFSVMSFCLVGTLISGVWLVAGAGWARAISLPALYLLFALPVFGSMIDVYTNPLQLLSTSTAFHLLDWAGYHPFRPEGSTVILLSNFPLDVAVPCSGLKLVLAISAFTAFFMMIGRLPWIGNTIMVLAVLPLCVLINGLRIALIGVVGENYGDAAGRSFHDFSGYVTLVVCFALLFGLARCVGWKG